MGQLIQTGLADKAANRCNPRVIVHFEHATGHGVLIHQFFFPFFCIDIHRTELIKLEIATIFPDPLLGENSWTSILANQGHQHDPHQATDNQAHQRTTDINHTFCRHVARFVEVGRECDDIEPSHFSNPFVASKVQIKSIEVNGNIDPHGLKL